MLPAQASASEIESLLCSGSMRFPAWLEALLERRCRAVRRAHLKSFLLWMALAMLAPLVLDAIDSASMVRAALLPRVGVAALAVGSALVLRRLVAWWAEELAVAVPQVAIVALTVAFGKISGGLHADRYMMAAALAIAAFNVLAPVSLGTARRLSLLGLASYMGVFVLVPGSVAWRTNLDLPLFALGLTVASLLVVRRDERSRRRSFLLALRDEIGARELGRLNGELLTQSTTDCLTGLANRRSVDAELRRLGESGAPAPFGALLVDIDRFKALNDSAGHAAGDLCLRAVARAIAAGVGVMNAVAGRYGGEEFVVLLPGAGEAETRAAGERVRLAVECLGFPNPGTHGGKVTVSVGGAWQAASGWDAPPEQVLRQADRALYAAKQGGRNTVCLQGDSDPGGSAPLPQLACSGCTEPSLADCSAA